MPSLLRTLRDWRWLFAVVAALSALAFLGRRFLPEGGGAATPGTGPDLRASEAAAHVGETATVCGRVAEAVYLPRVDGRPTFLNFGAPAPRQAFTAVIWGEARARFDAAPERAYRGARVCVAGEIREHEGTPQIELRGPGQLRVERPGPARRGGRGPAAGRAARTV